MKILKLILHYNTPEQTKKLCSQVSDAIVIDNGSDPPFPCSEVDNMVLRFDTNLGFTPNWNRAIKHFLNTTKADAFWLMNSDIEISWVSIERIESIMDFMDISMITPSYNCWMPYCHNKNLPFPREVKCIEFTAPVIRRDVFERIGLLDETFVRGYGVEFDWSLRMQKEGLKQFCDDQSRFHHIGQQTIQVTGGLKAYEAMAVKELDKGMKIKYGTFWRQIVRNKLGLFNSTNNMKIAVYTTIFGQYNNLIPVPKQTVAADFFCITDTHEVEHATPLGEPGEGEEWRITKVDYPCADLHPRMRAKYFKFFPWEAKELSPYNLVIFIDGSIEITSKDFVRHLVDSLGHSDMALYRHPDRDCIYDEAQASTGLVKYANQNISGQVDFYKSIHPKHDGLFACGVMIRRNKNEKMRQVMNAWWWENIKWTYQDQISFPVVCKIIGFLPAIIPGHQYKNPFFKVHWHDDKEPKTKKLKK